MQDNDTISELRCSQCNKLLVRAFAFDGYAVAFCSRCKTHYPMGQPETVALLDFRCPDCSRLLMKASPEFRGGLEVYCKRCSQPQMLVSHAQKRKCQYPDPLPTAKPLDRAEILAVMEERWRLLWRKQAMKRTEVANGLRFRIFQRDGFRCRYCGHLAEDGALLEVDHIMPRAKGGTDNEENLVTACWECNSGKSDKLLTAAST